MLPSNDSSLAIPSVAAAIALVNAVPDKRLNKLLQRVLAALPTNTRAFTAAEEEALQEALELSSDKTTLLLQTVAFIFETAVYHELTDVQLGHQLTAIGCQAPQVASFVKCWAATGAGVVAEFSNHAFFDKRLTAVKWRLNLSLAQSSVRKMAAPNAIIELTIDSCKAGAADHVQMEFSHAELFDLYSKLELIQNQLDQLA